MVPIVHPPCNSHSGRIAAAVYTALQGHNLLSHMSWCGKAKILELWPVRSLLRGAPEHEPGLHTQGSACGLYSRCFTSAAKYRGEGKRSTNLQKACSISLHLSLTCTHTMDASDLCLFRTLQSMHSSLKSTSHDHLLLVQPSARSDQVSHQPHPHQPKVFTLHITSMARSTSCSLAADHLFTPCRTAEEARQLARLLLLIKRKSPSTPHVLPHLSRTLTPAIDRIRWSHLPRRASTRPAGTRPLSGAKANDTDAGSSCPAAPGASNAIAGFAPPAAVLNSRRAGGQPASVAWAARFSCCAQQGSRCIFRSR